LSVQVSVVILAAGQGRRMHSDLPKVLQPLAGKPLLEHVLRVARELHPAHIYIVYGHGGALVRAALPDAALDWVLQGEQLGTGHAVMQAMPLIADHEIVLVLYGDVPLVRAPCLERLLAAAAAGALALLTVELDDPTGYGRIVRESGKTRKPGNVVAIVEHKDATAQQRLIREANSGLLAAPAAALREWLLDVARDNAQGEYYLTDVVAGAVQSGTPVVAVAVDSPVDVMGVNDKVQLAHVEAAYRARRARDLMLAGVTLADPLRIDIRGEVTVERDVFIDVNAVLSGRVHLGARVSVGPGCVIQDARIGADTQIKAHSVIEDAVVGGDCRIGPFARLRPGTVLADRVHIGNYVEIKNSTIGSASKENHLSSLGDATVGSAVNVGAGTITCNYDGANKWPTLIEDGAFIGSGSMLVAPVRIGAGATIGAGSTITDAAAADKLTLARARQATLDSWTPPGKASEADAAATIEAAIRAAVVRSP
jgi:bifunctional UDP-N-acetylglucosamine pyrophosphorylase/glucosamine-1-phosphate N-acetyltransferase